MHEISEIRMELGRGTTGRLGRRLAAWAGIAAPMVFGGLVALASLLRPGYSQISEWVSYLGYGPNAILQNLNFVATGALLVCVAVGLGAALPRSGGKWVKRTKVALQASGLAVAIAGVSLMLVDVLPAGSAFITHTVASFVAFGTLIGAQLATARALKGSEDSAWTRYRRFSRVSGRLAGLLLITFVATMFGPFQGVTERLFIAVPMAWIEVTGWRLRWGGMVASTPAGVQDKAHAL